MKRKLFRLFVLFLLGSLQAAAQTAGYHYAAPIAMVDSSGFYNVVLTPAMNAHLKTDNSDLRIVNDSGKWVPHLVKFPNSEMSQLSILWDRKIIKNENKESITEVIIEGGIEGISNLVLKINNSSAERYCTLTGSDDMHSWFIINDSIRIVTEENGEDNTTHFTLRFPPVNYKYFKVSIHNNGKNGFKILHAGTTSSKDLPGEPARFPLIENPPVKISQKDSSSFSFIKIEQAAAYHFGKISLKVSGVKYFNRLVKFYIPTSAKHSFSNPGLLMAADSISNNSTLQFYVPLSKAGIFYMVIQNDDNLPLKVEEVKTFTEYSVATVYLEKATHYKLLLDNPASLLPNYDIRSKDIPSRGEIPLATVGSITAIGDPGTTVPSKHHSTGLIWLTIGLAAIVLGFFTYRLVTDISKSKS